MNLYPLDGAALDGPGIPPPTKALIRRALAAKLLADAAVSAVVGARVYPLVVPQSSDFPALTYQLVHLARERGLPGPLGITDGLFSFTVHSRNLSDGEAGAEAVRQLLDGLAGATFAADNGLVSILGCTLESERDLATNPADGSDRGVLMTQVDYTIRYREPDPRIA